jgi:predicted ATP-dependent endonuclease of OLD family
MKITKIKVNNYRLLKDFEIDLEDNLSLVIGKNNCGKTSLLSILERFLAGDQSNFSFNDLNISTQIELKDKIEKNSDEKIDFAIRLRLYINYTEDDNLKNISSMMLNLNPEENYIVLCFEYVLNYEKIIKLKEDYNKFKGTIALGDNSKDILYFLRKNHKNYFQPRKRALEFNNEENYIDITENRKLNSILNFQRIKARRDVADSDGTQRRSEKTLSKLSSKYYENVSDVEEENINTKELRVQLGKTDETLTKVYAGLFEQVVNKVKKFGGIKEDESQLRILSTLEEKNILKENTSVIYDQNSQPLPEDYNGLGYLNLIAIIFEIEVILNEFKKKRSKLEEPSDINLFFIEEPEAHTHPQMQYVFIKNIKSLLEEESQGKTDGIQIKLQTIISTHSSHITAESEFDDVKYFYRKNENEVIAKNLSALKNQYKEDPKQFQFLQQYLTLNRAELFFADKAILIEGDTERILLPAMMKKLDNETKEKGDVELLSQNISIVEVGAYSHIFEKFIYFLGIKTLILTDIDSVDNEGKVCLVAEGVSSSNSALGFFLKNKSLKYIKELNETEKILLKKDQDISDWVADKDGKLYINCQLEEDGYHARSFEDAFIHINRKFINDKKSEYRGLKNRKDFDDPQKNAFDLANNCINKKTHFALDILYHSDDVFSNWEIPVNIKNGLLWLKK